MCDQNKRLRNLTVWDSVVHLDGPLGGSLAYTFPVALMFLGRLAPVYLIVISVILLIVGNGYKIICKNNPDGGGVYSTLRKSHRLLAIVGVLLLVTDYVATSALSVTDSFHYLSLDKALESRIFQNLPTIFKLHGAEIWTITILIILTLVNWKGPHFSAKCARFASIPTFFLAGFLAILALPLIPAGLQNIGPFNQSLFDILKNTTAVLLALSGIEAISNMTGCMKNPKETSNQAINIEMIKVIFTTVVLGIAINALPPQALYQGQMQNGVFVFKTQVREEFSAPCLFSKLTSFFQGLSYECKKITYNAPRNDTLVALSNYLIPGIWRTWYGLAIGLSFSFLLIFAANTAIIDISNVSYSLAKDHELPTFLSQLNNGYHVPYWGVILGGILPIIVILLFGAKLESLAQLYALGVVGAISLNLCGTSLKVLGKEKIITLVGGLVMSVLFITLAYHRIEAALFALVIIILGLTARKIEKSILMHYDKIRYETKI